MHSVDVDFLKFHECFSCRISEKNNNLILKKFLLARLEGWFIFQLNFILRVIFNIQENCRTMQHILQHSHDFITQNSIFFKSNFQFFSPSPPRYDLNMSRRPPCISKNVKKCDRELLTKVRNYSKKKSKNFERIHSSFNW